ncbi:MAG: HlyD family type I secretion periplasmic adaptor subunit [Hydrogenophaga sp.]|jgi:hemolysin D|nr:HlyD family type I secretion periplasmic adaptor subunit [Hydrogenophaga sp.]
MSEPSHKSDSTQANARTEGAPTWEDFSPANIAMQQRSPAIAARMVTLSLCAMAVAATAYAYTAHMDVVVTSQGSVITPGRSKVVQPLEAGVVRAIRVRDGQEVKSGDVLLELDPTNSEADSERLTTEFAEARAEVDRLHALLEGREFVEVDEDIPDSIMNNQQAILENRRAELKARLSALDADIATRQADREAISVNLAQLRKGLELVKKRHGMREELAQTGHIAELALIDTQLELANQEKEVAVQSQRLVEASSAIRSSIEQRALAVAEFKSRLTTELVEAIKRKGSLEKDLKKAQQRTHLQVLRSPIDGVVQQLAVFTEGGVVTQAQVLMTIVPLNEGLEVESKVLNRDIGHVRVGQRVINKIETFDFTRHGYIEGEVQWVGTDAVIDERLGPIYPVRIKLGGTEMPQVVRGEKGRITAGMSVTSDIRIGDRRMVDYFLAPLLRYKEESLRER